MTKSNMMRNIPLSRVGKDARSTKGVYTDKYTAVLDKSYPVDDIFGKVREEITDGGEWEINGITWRLARKSESDGETLNRIIHNSVGKGSWQPERVGWERLKQMGISAKEAINILSGAEIAHDRYGHTFPRIQNAMRAGLVLLAAHAGNVYVLPSQKTVEYFASRTFRPSRSKPYQTAGQLGAECW
jgi:hypothetical protein